MSETMVILAGDVRAATARPEPGATLPHVVRDEHGWLTTQARHVIDPREEPLESHADWQGPVKLTTRRGRCVARADVYAGHPIHRLASPAPAASEGQEEFLAKLIDCTRHIAARLPPEDWTPPQADLLSTWLADRGYSPTVDEDGTVHLTLRSRGRDGQIRLASWPGHLRMTMRLGKWTALDPFAERAMLQLARDCNATSRLARIAWFRTDDARQCEAQVDFTGLPVESAECDWFWPDMLQLAVSGMDLMLRRLGLELDVLADPANASIARRVTAMHVRNVRRAK